MVVKSGFFLEEGRVFGFWRISRHGSSINGLVLCARDRQKSQEGNCVLDIKKTRTKNIIFSWRNFILENQKCREKVQTRFYFVAYSTLTYGNTCGEILLSMQILSLSFMCSTLSLIISSSVSSSRLIISSSVSRSRLIISSCVSRLIISRSRYFIVKINFILKIFIIFILVL